MARSKPAPDQNEIETAGIRIGKGQFILQDRKAVLDAVPDEPLPGVEKMVNEFLTPQLVKSKSSRPPFCLLASELIDVAVNSLRNQTYLRMDFLV